MVLLSRFYYLISHNKKLSRAVKNIAGFYPRRVHYYELAFRHRSAAIEVKDGFRQSNERLEYLGDSILGAVVAEFLYKRFPYKDEGFLTKMRSKIVSKENLSRIAKKLGMSELLTAKFENTLLLQSVNEDTFEAFLGAVYMDRGYFYARKFILQRIFKNHLDIDELEQTDTDYKSQFIEWAQGNKTTFEFVLASESGQGHKKLFCIHLLVNGKKIGEGISHSKKKAEQQASFQGLGNIELENNK